MNAFLTALMQFANHPKAGALAIFIAVGGIAVGYWWSTDTFASTDTVQQLKKEIIEDVDKLIIKRDMASKEEEIRKQTQQISLNICADSECRWNVAEKATLERQVETLRRQLIYGSDNAFRTASGDDP